MSAQRTWYVKLSRMLAWSLAVALILSIVTFLLDFTFPGHFEILLDIFAAASVLLFILLTGLYSVVSLAGLGVSLAGLGMWLWQEIKNTPEKIRRINSPPDNNSG